MITRLRGKSRVRGGTIKVMSKRAEVTYGCTRRRIEEKRARELEEREEHNRGERGEKEKNRYPREPPKDSLHGLGRFVFAVREGRERTGEGARGISCA